jgi:hypothetical protein
MLDDLEHTQAYERLRYIYVNWSHFYIMIDIHLLISLVVVLSNIHNH